MGIATLTFTDQFSGAPDFLSKFGFLIHSISYQHWEKAKIFLLSHRFSDFKWVKLRLHRTHQQGHFSYLIEAAKKEAGHWSGSF